VRCVPIIEHAPSQIIVIPAQAGIHAEHATSTGLWIPASAGKRGRRPKFRGTAMTGRRSKNGSGSSPPAKIGAWAFAAGVERNKEQRGQAHPILGYRNGVIKIIHQKEETWQPQQS
jgi:hypothetical protein